MRLCKVLRHRHRVIDFLHGLSVKRLPVEVEWDTAGLLRSTPLWDPIRSKMSLRSVAADALLSTVFFSFLLFHFASDVPYGLSRSAQGTNSVRVM